MNPSRSAEQVFDEWALDYHAPGMEDEHWPSVREAFDLIADSDGLYLEIGVGNGYGLFYMATNQYMHGKCVGIDVSRNMVDLAQKRVMGLENASVRHAEFLEFQPEDESPDLIFSMEVFYYLHDMEEGMRHAYDVLASGGQIMILVNHYRERADTHEWPDKLGTPMQLWSAQEYLEAMKRAGFERVGQRMFGVAPDSKYGTLGTWGFKPSDVEASR
jgi:SAM-dependent methyltransferase